MKKVTTLLSMIMLVAFIAQGQELTSKKGFTILPEEGDYVIGFNAIPLIDFALNTVNIMNNTGQTGQHLGYVNGFNQVLVGKYFLESDLAIRGKLGINTNTVINKTFFDNPHDVFTNPGDPSKWEEISDVNKTSNKDIIIGGGLEFRRGHNRLQGFYGGELLIGLGSSNITNKYGVEMTQDAITNGYTNANGTSLSGRVLANKSGANLLFGLRGFAGVEYFFAPKMSIASEFGWGLGMTTTPRGKVKTEKWDTTNNKAETAEKSGNSKGSVLGFAVDEGIGKNLAPSGAVSIYFHF